MLITMDTAMQTALLNRFNTDRNRIALGQISPYTVANNMGTVSWDNNLAAGCTTNVQQCASTHTLSSGQNLASQWTTGQALVAPADIASLAGGQWFDNEQVNGGFYGGMNLINSFNPGDTS